ncbi:hypothetical protein ASF03_21090 [Rhizobium sp. Leaf68]|nr:hypothetical protein ASE62_20545 [Rhizobium sp. Leaf202]KQN80422.1 hypothetical protein ASF03_21090 [Rhizobium sp. Leaf68]
MVGEELEAYERDNSAPINEGEMAVRIGRGPRAKATRSVRKKSDAIPRNHNQKTNIDKCENFSLTAVMNSPIDRSSIFCLPSFVYRAIGTAL